MKNSDGFTIVEVAVTLVIIGIFSMVILMMQTQVSNISVLEVQHTKASYLAYGNMRKYANDLMDCREWLGRKCMLRLHMDV